MEHLGSIFAQAVEISHTLVSFSYAKKQLFSFPQAVRAVQHENHHVCILGLHPGGWCPPKPDSCLQMSELCYVFVWFMVSITSLLVSTGVKCWRLVGSCPYDWFLVVVKNGGKDSSPKHDRRDHTRELLDIWWLMSGGFAYVQICFPKWKCDVAVRTCMYFFLKWSYGKRFWKLPEIAWLKGICVLIAEILRKPATELHKIHMSWVKCALVLMINLVWNSALRRSPEGVAKSTSPVLNQRLEVSRNMAG